MYRTNNRNIYCTYKSIKYRYNLELENHEQEALSIKVKRDLKFIMKEIKVNKGEIQIVSV